MMTYRRDSKSRFLTYGVVTALCIILLWFVAPYAQRVVTLFAEYTGIAHTKLYQKGGEIIDHISLYAKSNSALYEELRNAQYKNNELQSEILILTTYKDIANRFQLDADPRARILTERIGRVDGFLYNSFRIAKRDTSCTNPLVVGEKQILLGAVVENNTYTSLVKTAWNGEQLLGRLSASSTPITLLGEQDGTYTARVPKTVPVQLRDVVTLDTNPFIMIGSVVFVDENVHENETIITIQIPFSPQHIHIVELICPYE